MTVTEHTYAMLSSEAVCITAQMVCKAVSAGELLPQHLSNQLSTQQAQQHCHMTCEQRCPAYAIILLAEIPAEGVREE